MASRQAREGIIYQGHGRASAAVYRRAIATLPDAADYEIRCAEGRWWVVYISPWTAPDEIIRRSALADVRAAVERVSR